MTFVSDPFCIRRELYFQDWEDYLYIDPFVVTSSTLWMLNFQRSDGAFVENGHYLFSPLHLAMKSTDNATESVPLTAHVLITLEEVAKLLTVRLLYE